MNFNMEKVTAQRINLIKGMCSTLKMGFKVSPLHFVIFIACDILNCILCVAMTVCTQHFFEVVMKNSVYSMQVVCSLVIMCMIIITQHFINGAGHTIIPALKLKMDRDAMLRFNKKMQQFPAVWFENQDFLNFVEKAYRGTEYSFAVLVPFFRFLVQYGPYCILIGIYMYTLDPVLAVSIILIFVPTFLSVVLRPEILFDLEDKDAPVRRRAEHYRQCITEPEYFKETRLLKVFDYFKDKYVQSIEKSNKLVWNVQKKIRLLDFVTSFISVCGYGGVVFLLVNSLLKGNINVAMFAAVFSSIRNMYDICDDAVGHFLAPVDGMATVRNFLAIMNVKVPQEREEEIDFKKEIVFKDVYFSYVGCNEQALKNVSFRIKGGETIAIVGENGSGKTTLSRLLLGIYTPTNGSVVISGQDTRLIARKSITQGMSAVFQNFAKYKLTVEENIRISDSERTVDSDYLDTIMEQADIDVDDNKFYDGVNTMLSRDFDGIDLSGGQWQRIAIARGLYRNRDVIVLDEPTAAIDPIEETKLYEKFAEIAKGKTTFLITHRIGSVKIADRILVMKKGEVIAFDTHDNLLKGCDLYREMYESQNRWYHQ